MSKKTDGGFIPFDTNVIQPFNIYTFTEINDNRFGYCHWSEGLSMIIMKNGIKIELNSDEIQQLVKSLPRTVGGVY